MFPKIAGTLKSLRLKVAARELMHFGWGVTLTELIDRGNSCGRLESNCSPNPMVTECTLWAAIVIVFAESNFAGRKPLASDVLFPLLQHCGVVPLFGLWGRCW